MQNVEMNLLFLNKLQDICHELNELRQYDILNALPKLIKDSPNEGYVVDSNAFDECMDKVLYEEMTIKCIREDCANGSPFSCSYPPDIYSPTVYVTKSNTLPPCEPRTEVINTDVHLVLEFTYSLF